MKYHNLPPHFLFADIFGIDDIQSEKEREADDLAIRRAAREVKKWLNRQQKRLRRVGLEIARDKHWLERQHELEAWKKKTAEEEAATDTVVGNLRAAMHNELERVHNELERAWLTEQLKRVERAGRDIAKDMARAERKELMRRAVVRGVRRKTAV